MRQISFQEKVDEFLNSYDYDVRKSGDARWIDQKCTFDVINIIADCIVEFTDLDTYKEFTISDIWHSEYARNNVITIFSKPDPELKAGNEYDKYFGQPIKLLAYSNVLSTRKSGTRYFYKIANKELLKYISIRPMNALDFLIKYIKKVLSDSFLWEDFSEFFRLQTKQSYLEVKEKFENFTIQYTPINQKLECGRIFTKILNPIAFEQKKCGSECGRISKYPIKLEELQYNRQNWRDILANKNKFVPRTEHEEHKIKQGHAYVNYTITKAKKTVRVFNDLYRNKQSEVKQTHMLDSAIHMHHIFPQAEYPEISAYLENLIALTPTQHLSFAHPNNNTSYIDIDYQYICILSKACSVYSNIVNNFEEEIYDFENLKFVLNTGLRTIEFNTVEYLDIPSLINKIDFFYMDHLTNKYLEIKKEAINRTHNYYSNVFENEGMVAESLC